MAADSFIRKLDGDPTTDFAPRELRNNRQWVLEREKELLSRGEVPNILFVRIETPITKKEQKKPGVNYCPIERFDRLPDRSTIPIYVCTTHDKECSPKWKYEMSSK
jgi:hypothetical protein